MLIQCKYSFLFLFSTASGKTNASEAKGFEFKSRADQIAHTLPSSYLRCKFEVGAWHKPLTREVVTPESVLSK